MPAAHDGAGGGGGDALTEAETTAAGGGGGGGKWRGRTQTAANPPMVMQPDTRAMRPRLREPPEGGRVLDVERSELGLREPGAGGIALTLEPPVCRLAPAVPGMGAMPEIGGVESPAGSRAETEEISLDREVGTGAPVPAVCVVPNARR